MSYKKIDLLLPETPVRYIKGVGPRKESLFKKLGVETVEDLLYLVPRRYIDLKKPEDISKLTINEQGSIYGEIIVVGVRTTKTKGDVVQIMVTDGTHSLKAIWFNRPDLKQKFKKGQKIILSGMVTFYKGKEMVNPYYQLLNESSKPFYAGTIIPVYPLTEGLSLWDIRRAIHSSLEKGILMPDPIPLEILSQYKFPPIMESFRKIHFPASIEETNLALNRFKFEELFLFETIVAQRKLKIEKEKQSMILKRNGKLTDRFISLLPFKLTNDQISALKEIEEDLAKPRPMHRLLQGDVGSGKTVIAIYTMLIAVENKTQACMMVPTEILAEQHYYNWKSLLENLGIKSGLLTGSLSKKEKDALYHDIEKGKIDIVFGTHALIEEGVEFKDLRVVIVDEQHRFGVMQRANLLAKGENPHFLVMTATPIPRTLSITYYGDLDISTLREKPKFKAHVKTEIVSESKRDQVCEFIKKILEKGEQVYVLCPLIEESKSLNLKAALKTFEEIKEAFPQAKVGLLHGRMKPQERFEVMEGFRRKDIDILVATTVIEVGIDIPNATVMVIFHPERFGLSQLHQLRGRIGRGEKTSYCIIIIPDHIGEDARKRIYYFSNINDGFQLSEKDLEIRGPGELMGTKQHGLPDLKIASLVKDKELLSYAVKESFKLVYTDSSLKKYPYLEETLKRRYKDAVTLMGVG